jgi:hypothetical protein
LEQLQLNKCTSGVPTSSLQRTAPQSPVAKAMLLTKIEA